MFYWVMPPHHRWSALELLDAGMRVDVDVGSWIPPWWRESNRACSGINEKNNNCKMHLICIALHKMAEMDFWKTMENGTEFHTSITASHHEP